MAEKIVKKYDFNCPVDATIKVICGKYKGIILFHLMEQTLRFNQIQKVLGKATPKMVTQQLRELEKDGIINRKVYPVVPPKVEYSLTEYGQSVIPVLKMMRTWGEGYITKED